MACAEKPPRGALTTSAPHAASAPHVASAAPAANARGSTEVSPEVAEAPELGAADAAAPLSAGNVDAAAPDAEQAYPDLSAEIFMAPLDLRRQLTPQSFARRFANLSPSACMQALRAAKLPYKPWGGPAKGIANPLRLSGPVAGVVFVSPGGKSPFGLLDCRLLLALREFARVLASHDVVRVQLDNMYRPQSKLPAARRGKRRPPSQHAHGLAADITRFWLKDGAVLRVAEDWQGELGEPACGPSAKLKDPTTAAIRLRNLVCAVAAEGIFNHMLTPGFNAAHRDHFHFDIKRGADYQALR